jgi:hypothetical protein
MASLSEGTLSERAQVITEEVHGVLELLRRNAAVSPRALEGAAPDIASPLRQAFADLAEVCALLAAEEPDSIHHGPLQRSASALHSLERDWYAVWLNGGCSGVV